jgi:hypothetical protein
VHVSALGPATDVIGQQFRKLKIISSLLGLEYAESVALQAHASEVRGVDQEDGEF